MRNSLQQLEAAKAAALAELARDKAHIQARMDDYQNIISVLKEGLEADLLAMATIHQNERLRMTQRFETLKAHFLSEIDKEGRALADLEGRPVIGTQAGDGPPNPDETVAANVSLIGHNRRRKTEE